MIEVFGNNSKKEMKLDNPLSFNKCYILSVSLYTDFVLRNMPTDQVVVMNEGIRDESVISIRLQLKQIRIDLEWRTDLDDLNKK